MTRPAPLERPRARALFAICRHIAHETEAAVVALYASSAEHVLSSGDAGAYARALYKLAESLAGEAAEIARAALRDDADDWGILEQIADVNGRELRLVGRALAIVGAEVARLGGGPPSSPPHSVAEAEAKAEG
ncbi:MAG TPA: hypothetical protein VFS43_13290 [Polyangiaceae bacterium]|nr:hypothetical protein [Polyangiaceae bacterium]